MKAVILAAGQGVRMQPLTSDTPKALLKIHKKPLLHWLLRQLHKAGVNQAIVVVKHHASQIKETLSTRCQGVRLEYARQSMWPGTAAALSSVRKKIKPPFLLCNADVVLPSKTYRALTKAKHCAAAMAVRLSGHAEHYGVVKLSKGRVLALKEKPRGKNTRAWVNAGAYAFFAKTVFEDLVPLKPSARGEYELTDLLKNYIKEGKVKAVKHKGAFWDLGTPNELEAANRRKNPFR